MKEKFNNLEFDIVKKAVSENCSFSLGKEYVANRMPVYDYLWVNRELNRGKEALKLYAAYGSANFTGVRDISKTLKTIEKSGIVTNKELYEIAAFCRASFHFKKYRNDSDIKATHIFDLIDSLSTHKNVFEEIERCISTAYEINDNASLLLKDIRRNIHNVEAEIVKATQEFMVRHANILMENITAVRNNRTCVLVKNSDKNKIKGFIHGESASGMAVYIEPEVLLNLNNRLQSFIIKEQEEMERIIIELCQLVRPYVNELLADLDTYILLDAYFAQAKWAYDRCGTYADLKRENDILYFKDARHPLIDEDKVVSNTYRLENPYHHLLISGSNTGGKTVTLKTIGLFTVLTLAGMPLLCEEAIVPIFDGVYVDVGDSQSIVESLSTFSAHLSKISYICNHATSNSLVLLDELGSGTDPLEGECLAIAILDYLKVKKVMSICTTHYSKVKEYAKKEENILVASVAFDMEKMCPTYKYVEGYAGSSNALEIAKRFGILDEIIEKARMLKQSGKSETAKLMEKLDQQYAVLKQQEEQIEKTKAALKEKEEQFNKEKQQFVRMKEKQMVEVQEKTKQIMEEAQEKADAIIRALEGLDKDVKKHQVIALKSQLKTEEVEEEKETNYDIKVGDYVQIKKLDYHGEVLSVKGNRATVFANGMKMNVKKNELIPTSKPKPKKAKASASRPFSAKTLHSECNVIGMHVDEALAVIDKYLDSALYLKMDQVRLVHGVGTGTLRKAIHEYLKKNKIVESYRLGGEGEGFMGATVVSLKRGAKNG